MKGVQVFDGDGVDPREAEEAQRLQLERIAKAATLLKETMAGQIGGFTSIAMPMIRASMNMKNIVDEIVGVQPITAKSGTIFASRMKKRKP